MNLVLIGYRGTGKSHVGNLVAKRTRMNCVHMDEEIEKKAGMTIPAIVEKFGWPHFRDLESALAAELASCTNMLIDTGGGIVERPENVDILGRNACIIWLKAPVEIIVQRIKSGSHRPSLTTGKTFTEEVADVLARRTPLYAKACNHIIDTENLSPTQVADEVVTLWEEWKKQQGRSQ